MSRPPVRSEGLGQTSLLERLIGRVPRLRAVVDREINLGNGAVPDLVIALAWAHEFASCFAKELFEFALEIGHPARLGGLCAILKCDAKLRMAATVSMGGFLGIQCHKFGYRDFELPYKILD